jgi:hypothetical protein
MIASKTITKRGDSELCDAYMGARGDWDKGSHRIQFELRYMGEMRGKSLSVYASLAEARSFAMELLGKLDDIQRTIDYKASPALTVERAEDIRQRERAL